MELKEELKKLGLMALTAVIMLFSLASIGGSIGMGITTGEAFYVIAGVGAFISLVFGFFHYFRKKKDTEIEIKKLNDEIEKLKKKK